MVASSFVSVMLSGISTLSDAILLPSISGFISSVGDGIFVGFGVCVGTVDGAGVCVTVGFGVFVGALVADGAGVGVCVGPVSATVTSPLQTDAELQLGVYRPTLNKYSPGPL